MRIIYRQSEEGGGLFERLGIRNFYLKELRFPDDEGEVLSKEHHHTCFEIHFLKSGHQIYELGEEHLELSQGEAIFIYPYVRHKVRGINNGVRYSVTFEFSDDEGQDKNAVGKSSFCFGAPISENIIGSIERIMSETQDRASYYSVISEGRAAEIVSELLRLAEINRKEESENAIDGGARFQMAKQYITDNRDRDVTVSAVACFCCISERQLSRIFAKEADMGVAEYSRKVRCSYLKELLADPSLSLKQISVISGFGNEYYFNSYFKRCVGMSPGAYRKSIAISN